MVGLFFTREGNQFDDALFPVVSTRHKPAAQVRKGPVHKAIGGNLGKSRIYGEAVVEQACSRLDAMSPGVEGTETIVYFSIGLVTTVVRLKVEAGAKGCGTVVEVPTPR